MLGIRPPIIVPPPLSYIQMPRIVIHNFCGTQHTTRPNKQIPPGATNGISPVTYPAHPSYYGLKSCFRYKHIELHKARS